jgi:diketogulonate reductase-like aldo/keto reductase
MASKPLYPTRRNVITALGVAGTALAVSPCALKPWPLTAREIEILKKPIPSTGEQIPIVGMGSWITFNVGNDIEARNKRVRILQTFFESGGALVDSSPMYGSSEDVIGYCLKRLRNKQGLFSATKVWTYLRPLGIAQMKRSERLWGEKPFDLLQIHNLMDWRTHLSTLLDWKAQGRVRYIGVTTSHGRRHSLTEKIIQTQPIDFVQFSYNIRDRAAEKRLLPAARERGLAVIINRPFRRGNLFGRTRGRPLPNWVGEFDCLNWAQFYLKFIVSHPAVTCAIPATSRVDHMQQNIGALQGRLPDPDMRKHMIKYFENI